MAPLVIVEEGSNQISRGPRKNKSWLFWLVEWEGGGCTSMYVSAFCPKDGYAIMPPRMHIRRVLFSLFPADAVGLVSLASRRADESYESRGKIT